MLPRARNILLSCAFRSLNFPAKSFVAIFGTRSCWDLRTCFCLGLLTAVQGLLGFVGEGRPDIFHSSDIVNLDRVGDSCDENRDKDSLFSSAWCDLYDST